MLKYVRTFQTTVALAAAGAAIAPFIKLGTQGNAAKMEVQEESEKPGVSTDVMEIAADPSQQMAVPIPLKTAMVAEASR